jgi:carbohydrate-selective porin OprB
MGISLHLDFWVLYQANVSGALQTARATAGEYRAAADFDLERLVKLNGASVFLEVRGGWDDHLSADINTLMAVNGEFLSESAIYVSRLSYQQDLLGDRLRFRIGKVVVWDGFDFHGQTVAFDANAYANSGATQFLNAGLINNVTIPFPDFGPGAIVFGEPVERVYVAGAVANADACRAALGFTNILSGDAHLFLGVEAGFVPELRASSGPLPAQYNVGYWNSEFAGASAGQGVHFGMNQLLYREGSDDLQGLGMFARYGWSQDHPAGIGNFWSLGARYRGLIPGRDHDVLGLGRAQSFTVGDPAYTAPYEGALEAYSRARVTPWFRLSPMVQYIVNPGSMDTPNAVVLGLRSQLVF